MNIKLFFARQHWRLSLRAKVLLVYGVPILLTALLIFFTNYSFEKKALEDQAHFDSIQMGSVILAGMKHTMMTNDHTMMGKILSSTSQQGNIRRIWILDNNGTVRLSNQPADVNTRLDTRAQGCIECHQFPPETRPLSRRIPNLPGVVRVVTPIDNETECQTCHSETEKHLGVLITDVSIQDLESQINSQLRLNLFLSIGLIIIGILVILEITNLLIVRRIEKMQTAMTAFESGDYSARITPDWRTNDELTSLANSFNDMASSIARHEEDQRKISAIRQQAIVEERERIARELHDGVSQFLGYLNNKISAISLLLEKDQKQAAQIQIEQVTQAIQLQSVDVRASIIGLKLSINTSEEFSNILGDYIDQFNQLSDLQVELVIEPPADRVKLQPETELHLLRIVQEAVSNIRKHAHTRVGNVGLRIEGQNVVLSISDAGIGFNPWEWNTVSGRHFGLQFMRERADLAGGEFTLESRPGLGTTVTVKIPVESG